MINYQTGCFYQIRQFEETVGKLLIDAIRIGRNCRIFWFRRPISLLFKICSFSEVILDLANYSSLWSEDALSNCVCLALPLREMRESRERRQRPVTPIICVAGQSPRSGRTIKSVGVIKNATARQKPKLCENTSPRLASQALEGPD